MFFPHCKFSWVTPTSHLFHVISSWLHFWKKTTHTKKEKHRREKHSFPALAFKLGGTWPHTFWVTRYRQLVPWALYRQPGSISSIVSKAQIDNCRFHHRRLTQWALLKCFPVSKWHHSFFSLILRGDWFYSILASGRLLPFSLLN